MSSDDSDSTSSKFWWLGVLCSLLACFGTVAGMLIQKVSHMKNEALPEADRLPWYKRKMWWLSLFFMIIVPSPLDIASFALAPQSLLAPLAAVTLLLNAVLAPWVLGEKLTRIDLYATLLIFTGATLSTLFGDHSQQVYTVPKLLDMFERGLFVAFQVTTVIVLVALYVFVKTMTPVKEKWDEEHLPEDYEVDYESVKLASDMVETPKDDSAPPATGAKQDKRGALLISLPFAFGLLAGLAGAQQMVITKCVSELVSKSIGGHNQFTYLTMYVLIALAIGFAIFQIGYISRGLSLYDATFFLPIYNAFLIVLSVTTGAVYFDEISHAPAKNIWLFFIGVAVTLSGVLLLTQRPVQARNRLDGMKKRGKGEVITLLDADAQAEDLHEPLLLKSLGTSGSDSDGF